MKKVRFYFLIKIEDIVLIRLSCESTYSLRRLYVSRILTVQSNLRIS